MLFCFALFSPYIVFSASITSNIVEYPAFCHLAASSPLAFSTFRQAPVYQGVLEHVSYQQGQDYLKIICAESPNFIPLFDTFRTNDDLGSPIQRDYGVYGTFAPTTLRYIKVASDLRRLFGPLDHLHILEIGGGYGGQCKILADLYDFSSYTLIDLPECNELSKKYLEQQGVKNVIWIDNKHLGDLKEHYDLVISNYAFSELDAAEQRAYLDQALVKSPRGYMTCNQTNHHANIDSLPISAWVLDLFAHGYKVQLSQEIPLTAPNNVLLTWRPY